MRVVNDKFLVAPLLISVHKVNLYNHQTVYSSGFQTFKQHNSAIFDILLILHICLCNKQLFKIYFLGNTLFFSTKLEKQNCILIIHEY